MVVRAGVGLSRVRARGVGAATVVGAAVAFVALPGGIVRVAVAGGAVLGLVGAARAAGAAGLLGEAGFGVVRWGVHASSFRVVTIVSDLSVFGFDSLCSLSIR